MVIKCKQIDIETVLVTGVTKYEPHSTSLTLPLESRQNNMLQRPSYPDATTEYRYWKPFLHIRSAVFQDLMRL